MASITTRTWTDGTIGHTFRVRLKGRTYTETFTCTAKKGQCKKAGCDGGKKGAQWAATRELEIKLGTSVAATVHTFKEVVEHHLKVELRKTIHSEANVKATTLRINWWKSKLGDYKLSDINADVIANLKASLATGKGSPTQRPLTGSTLNRYHDAIKQIWRTARKLRWVSHNPFTEIDLDEENPSRQRALDADEQQRLLTAARESRSEKLPLWVLAGLVTGARLSELERLTWRYIDTDRARITLVGTKNGTTRILPIAGTSLLTALKELKAQAVVPTEIFGVYPKEAYYYAVERAKLAGRVTFHTMRHTCATDLAAQGMTASQLMAFMGWKTIAMAQRYCHPNEAVTLDLADKVAARGL